MDQGLVTGDPVFFAGATDLAGHAITINTIDQNLVSGSLQVGTTYWAIVDPNNPNIVQFAKSLQDAQQGHALVLTSSSANVLATLLSPPLDNESPFTAKLPPVLVSFGTFNITPLMSGNAHTILPVSSTGVSITSHLASREKVVSTAEPGKPFILRKASVLAPSLYNSIAARKSNATNSPLTSKGSSNSVASQVASAPGGTGTAPKFAGAGSCIST